MLFHPSGNFTSSWDGWLAPQVSLQSDERCRAGGTLHIPRPGGKLLLIVSQEIKHSSDYYPLDDSYYYLDLLSGPTQTKLSRMYLHFKDFLCPSAGLREWTNRPLCSLNPREMHSASLTVALGLFPPPFFVSALWRRRWPRRGTVPPGSWPWTPWSHVSCAWESSHWSRWPQSHSANVSSAHWWAVHFTATHVSAECGRKWVVQCQRSDFYFELYCTYVLVCTYEMYFHK